MVKRASIEFVESDTPIQGLMTKFGGQPAWLSGAQWPLSRKTGLPMQFIGQIAFDREVFRDVTAQMAYVFMTQGDEFVDGTWEPDGGENAVVVQPGKVLVPTQPLTVGPTLYRMVSCRGRDRLVPEPCEFAVRLTLAEDPDFVGESERWEWDDEKQLNYCDVIGGNKIGGTPGFLQNDEFPGEDFRRLLLQLDSTLVPFSINFGDCGIGYAFLSGDELAGKFLWQCS
jgi:uncharacterized protein YwqG